LPFPYPKSSSSFRWLSVAGPEELIVLRTAAGHVVRSTDPLLSPRVHSNRLDRRYRCWRFRDYKKAWSRFINHGLSLLDGHRHSAMYRTDVEGYYPSVDVERLRLLMQECRCLAPAAALILKVFEKWHLRDGLRGLPIGPEVSAVIVAGPRLRLGCLRRNYATRPGADGGCESRDYSSASTRRDREPQAP
jgi:hypothetical protein